MAFGDRPWCDFIIYTTTKGVNVERIPFDNWQNTLPQLEAFFENCLGPEIALCMHWVFQFTIFPNKICY